MKAQIQYGNLTLSITYKAAEEGIEITAVETEDGTDIHEMLNTISDRYAAFLDKQIERRIGVWHEIERLTMAAIREDMGDMMAGLDRSYMIGRAA